MEMDELRRRLKVNLAAEEQNPADWSEVERLTSELQAQAYIDATPHIVHHFLADSDIRVRDDAYAARQRREIRRIVEKGDYDDGAPVPLWGCGGVLLLAGALIL